MLHQWSGPLLFFNRWLGGVCCGLLFLLVPVLAQQVVPALTGRVMDTTHTLSTEQLQQLESKLAAFEHSAGAQIVLLLVPTTQPEDIASYANRVADTWKIGRKQIGDGLLLVVAKNDRKVAIEVAKTLEGAVPDLAAKRVITEAIAPRFKQGDFAGGLDAGVDQIMKLVAGEALPAPSSVPGVLAGIQWMDLAIFAFIAVPVIGGVARKILGTNLGALVTGGAIGAIAMFITSSFVIAGLAAISALLFTLFSSVARSAAGAGSGSGGHGGWGGGGFGSGGGGGGGGFSSGGGGDFGGGGASGDW